MKRGRDGNVRTPDPIVTKQEALSMLRETVAKPIYDTIKRMDLKEILEYIATIRQLRK